MGNLCIIGGDDGILVCERETWRVIHRALEGRIITGLSSQGDRLIAGTTDGVFRSDDCGQTWRNASDGLTIRYVRQIAFHPLEPGLALAGTEPAAIFRTTDGGDTWHDCPEVTRLRESYGWFLPYSPGAGCIRAFAFHGPRAYAAAEIGGLLRSDDFGATWQLVAGSNGIPDFTAPVPRTRLHPDVHDVIVQPDSPDRLWVATMAGLYCSGDGGAKWLHIYADCYVRAVWQDPRDLRRLVLGPGDGVDINGQVERSADAGFTWEPATEGLAAPWRRAVVERFVPFSNQLLALSSDGRLYAAPSETLHWRRVLPEASQILAATECTSLEK